MSKHLHADLQADKFEIPAPAFTPRRLKHAEQSLVKFQASKMYGAIGGRYLSKKEIEKVYTAGVALGQVIEKSALVANPSMLTAVSGGKRTMKKAKRVAGTKKEASTRRELSRKTPKKAAKKAAPSKKARKPAKGKANLRLVKAKKRAA